jgi:5-methylcytosine-specific restriction protein B
MIPSNINKEHVLSAIEEIKKQGVPENRASVDYDLEYETDKYPPKYVITVANKYANGEELGPDKFSAHDAFRLLKSLEFNIVAKSSESKVEQMLKEFSLIADDFFKNNASWLQERFDFFKKFFSQDNIKRLEWKDIQVLGDNIHAFKAMAIAKGNALGNPNMPIEDYRNNFEYLAYGKDRIDIKIDSILSGEHKIKYFGESVITEIIGYVFSDEYVMFNQRDKVAVEFLGIDLGFSRGDTPGKKFLKYNNAVKPIIEKYSQIVGRKTPTSLLLEVDQFFSWLYENKIEKERLGEDKLLETDDKTIIRYWAIPPGEKAYLWTEWSDKNIITIGWDDLGDLNNYEDKFEIQKKLQNIYETEKSQKNNTRACYDFSKKMKPGDFVIVKTGTHTFLGIGKVISNYIFDNSRQEHKHVRKVEWLKRMNIEKPDDIISPAIKTLTNITQYTDYVKKVLDLFEMNGEIKTELKISDKRNYWWLNANPSIWRIQDFRVGDEQNYTSHNDKGNKRRIYEYFVQAQPGDLVIGYASTPVKKVIAIYEITEGLHQDDDEGEVITFKIREFVPQQVDWDTLLNLKDLENSEVMRNNQGSLFRLNEKEFNAIYRLTKDTLHEEAEKYDIRQALDDLFIKEKDIKSIVDRLKFKKNIIIQGPPGTGKTYIAKKIAYLMLGKRDESKIQLVQFHQSYSYEDFVQGFRPCERGDFELKNGVFYEFCSRAQRDPENEYFFIIDEINRGNLSKVFGELMMLIEHDKRGEEFAIPLTYSKDYQITFYIPKNLYLIGTMNTADRSLALVDYALRRRFSFIDLQPVYDDRFSEFLRRNKVNETIIKKIVNGITSLNIVIANDSNLGRGFTIGHSYFCNILSNPDVDWYNKIIESEIAPLLNEYWFDNEDKAKQTIENLLS